MPSISVRNLSSETHRALKARAAAHGRSTEAEIRAILDEAVRPPERLKVGTALRELASPFGGLELEIKRDRTPPEPAQVE